MGTRILDYYGAKKNPFHTILMISVVFSFSMRCRVPILLALVSVIVRSGFSFKPKVLPMFIDNKVLRPRTFYGSSYKLLHARSTSVERDLDDSSSEEDDEDDEDQVIDFDQLFHDDQ